MLFPSLRVIQEREFVRVGGNDPINIDIRVIAATNLDLERAVREGSFRQDFYYRLNVIPIVIPPLREHKRDIPMLVKHLIHKFNQEYGRSVQDISPSALKLLSNLEWKGNVREMENFVGRAIINMKFNEVVIRTNHLPVMEGKIVARGIKNHTVEKSSLLNKTLEEVVEEGEKQFISAVLNELAGNRTKAAQHLGISVRNLYYKIKKYNLDQM